MIYSTSSAASDNTPDGITDILGKRAARTRQSILEAARTLFLTHGYAGTNINDITDTCGISRPGFYTYFRDKREVFDLLGAQAEHETLAVLTAWETMPRPCSRSDIEAWVRSYFDFLDVHGAFILTPGSLPDAEDVHTAGVRMTMRGYFVLGLGLRAHQNTPTDTPEVLGLVIQSMLDRSWFQACMTSLPVGVDDIVRTVATTIAGILDA